MMHGEVKINDHEIARWTAERVPASSSYGMYMCTLEYTGRDGYHYEARDFMISIAEIHEKPHPVLLAAAVLENGAAKMKRKLEIGIS